MERAQASVLVFEINFWGPRVSRVRSRGSAGGTPPETMLLGDPTSIRETFPDVLRRGLVVRRAISPKEPSIKVTFPP